MTTKTHLLGRTDGGFEIYQYFEGEPVDFAYYVDDHGNCVKLPQASQILKQVAASFVNEFPGERLDIEWSQMAYDKVPSSEQKLLTWFEFHGQLCAMIKDENKIG